jgi:hypothetical protein
MQHPGTIRLSSKCKGRERSLSLRGASTNWSSMFDRGCLCSRVGPFPTRLLARPHYKPAEGQLDRGTLRSSQPPICGCLQHTRVLSGLVPKKKKPPRLEQSLPRNELIPGLDNQLDDNPPVSCYGNQPFQIEENKADKRKGKRHGHGDRRNESSGAIRPADGANHQHAVDKRGDERP